MACAHCALCCQCVRFIAPPDEDRERWMRLFGIGTSPLPDGRTQIILPRRCANLTDELACSDYDNRPAICRDFLCDDARKEAAA